MRDELFQRIAESFQRQSMLTTMGARLAHVASGEVTIELPASDKLSQQHGFMHAGAVATIADSACGYACLTRMPEGSAVLSVEFKINLLAPAAGRLFTARGRTARVGKTIGVATAEVFAHTDEPGAAGTAPASPPTLIAIMQATMIRVEPKNGKQG
jgi:uncharacterized protein (TIGR00369 family)